MIIEGAIKVYDEKAFALHGGFRGVQAIAAREKGYALVLIEKYLATGMPNFKRHASYYRIGGWFIGDMPSEQRPIFVNAVIEQLLRTAAEIQDIVNGTFPVYRAPFSMQDSQLHTVEKSGIMAQTPQADLRGDSHMKSEVRLE
jgi:hypothetical protein